MSATAIIGAAALGLSALGSLFGSDPNKANLKAMREQWQRQDTMRPYSSGLMDNPIMNQRMNSALNNNMFNWGAFQDRMSPRMLDMLNMMAPQYSMYGDLKRGINTGYGSGVGSGKKNRDTGEPPDTDIPKGTSYYNPDLDTPYQNLFVG